MKLTIKIFGPRIIKTGIAVSLSLLLAQLAGIDSLFFAGIAAIITLQPNIALGLQRGFERTLGTIIGGGVAIIVNALIDPGVIIVGITTMVVIAILVKLKLHDTIPITMVVMLIIMLEQPDATIYYTLERIGATIIGITVATIINYYFIAPMHHPKMMEILNQLNSKIIDSLNNIKKRKPNKNMELTDLRNSFWDEFSYLEREVNSRYSGNYEGVTTKMLASYRRINQVYFSLINHLEEIWETFEHQKGYYDNLPDYIVEYNNMVYEECYKISKFLEYIDYSRLNPKKNVKPDDFSEAVDVLKNNKGSLKNYLKDRYWNACEGKKIAELLELAHLAFIIEEIREKCLRIPNIIKK